MTNELFVDIETLPIDENDDKGALSPMTGTIALIGMIHNDSQVLQFLTDEIGEEAMLRKFWDYVWTLIEKGNLLIIGHNIAGFDADFLIKRAWKYGIKVPQVLVEDLNSYRQKRWVDTMSVWGFFTKTGRIKLKTLCEYFDISVKTSEVQGKDFYKWWKTDKEKCKEYCGEDVMAVRTVYQTFKRLGIF